MGPATGSTEVYLSGVEVGPSETYDLLVEGKRGQSQNACGPSGRWEHAGP